MTSKLEILLQKVDAGVATDDELAEFAALMEADDSADPDIGAAVMSQLPPIDIADAVMGAISDALPEAPAPVGEAVRHEAGGTDVSRPVLAALDHWVLPVDEAVRDEAGRIDVTPQVLDALDIDWIPVAQAVRAEAGTCDVTEQVMRMVQPAEGPLTLPTQPVPHPAARPTAANRNAWMMVAMAAMFLGVIGITGLSGGLDGVLFPGDVDGNTVVADGSNELVPAENLLFASAADVVVEDLSFGDGVTVMQDEGADGALILWVDEELL